MIKTLSRLALRLGLLGFILRVVRQQMGRSRQAPTGKKTQAFHSN